MNTEKTRIIPVAVLGIAVPIVLGVMIELACDLLKYVVHYFSTSIYFDVQHKIWLEVRDKDTWLGLAFAIVLVVLSTLVLDKWKWAHPRREVRTALFVISVIVAAVVDPSGHFFKDDLLKAFGDAKVGERAPDVLKRFQYASPSIVLGHNQFDCVGACWLRLSYEVPETFGLSWVSLEFDQDQILRKKTP
jgi:hypothetical protein